MDFSFKMYLSKTINVAASIAIMIVVCQGVAQAQRADFSGAWKLNRQKTNFGQLSEISVPVQFSIDQKSDSISIDRVTKNGQDELHSYSEKLPLNGNTIEVMTNLYTKKITSIHLLADSQLTEVAQYVDYSDNVRYNGTEMWVLSNDGKVLTITRDDKANGLSYMRKMVYDRQ